MVHHEARGSASDRALLLHRMLMRFGLTVANLLALVSIAVTSIGLTRSVTAGVIATLLWYALAQLVVFILTPLSGRALRHGTRRGLVYGTLAAASACIFFASFYTTVLPLQATLAAMALYILGMALHRALYWVPYSTTLPSAPSAIEMLIRACVPLVLGVVLSAFPSLLPLMFLFAGFCILISIVPLMRVSDTYEHFEWHYGETFEALFASAQHDLLKFSIIDGMQGLTLIVLWPLIIFIILRYSFLGLTIVLTVTALVTALIRFTGSAVLRRLNRSTPLMATLVFSSWIIRLVPSAIPQFLLVDVYHHTIRAPQRASVDPLLMEQAADAAHYVDEYTALKEMGMALGRFFMCLFVIFATLVFGLQLACALSIVLIAIVATYSFVSTRRLARSV